MPASKAPAPEALDTFTESINILCYADPGAGKTVLGGTAEEALIIALEPGTVSAQRRGSDAQVVRCVDYETFAAVLNELRGGRYLNPRTGRPFKWVIVDTLTKLQELLAQDIMRRAHADSPKRSASILDMLGHQEWQQLFKRIVNALNDLPENVLYLCHTMEQENDEGDKIVLPLLVGKNGTPDQTAMSRWVVATVHAFGPLRVGNDGLTRRWLFAPEGSYSGKDRYGVLSPFVENPTMAQVEQLIVGSGEEE